MPEYSVSHPSTNEAGSTTFVEKNEEFSRIITASDPAFSDLKAKLNKKHAEYKRSIDYWLTAQDIAFNRVKGVLEKRKYLVQGLNESDESYAMRIELSPFNPETPELISDFIGSVFTIPATREIAEEKVDEDTARRLQAFIDAAGMQSEPLEEVSKRALAMALVYNRVDAFLDRPADAETETPYITLIPPQNRYDWDEDEKGDLLWIKFHEYYMEQPNWNDKPIHVDEYRIVTRNSVEITEDGVSGGGSITTYRIIKDADGNETIEGPFETLHNFHDIPVRTLWWNRFGEAWAKTLVELDRTLFRMVSDHAFDVFEAAHPPILAWMHAEEAEGDEAAGHAKAVKRISLGTLKVIHLNPGDGDTQTENVERMPFDVGPFEHQAEQIERLRRHIRVLAGSSTESAQMGGAIQNPESGIALSIKAQQREKNFRRATSALGEHEWQLSELVLREDGGQDLEREDIIHLQYPNSFDLRDLNELAVNLQDAQAIGSDTLVKEVKKSIATKLLGSGATAQTMQTINDEIKALPTLEEERENEMEMEMEVKNAGRGTDKTTGQTAKKEKQNNSRA